MEAVHLDTHAVVWLFQKDLARFTPETLALMENSDLQISPMVVLELEFLYEIGRLKYQSTNIVSELLKTIGLKVSEEPFSIIAYGALNQAWTRDPFDRLIVANAAHYNATLISKDRNILTHYERAVW